MLLRPRPFFSLYRLQRLSTSSSGKEPWYAACWNRYDKWLQKHPRVYKYHRLMVDGTVHCFNDSNVFSRVFSELRQGKQLHQFSRGDLEIYVLTSRDIVRVVVILIMMWTPPPIAETYFLLMLCFPRLLLTRHFWTPHQTEKFRAMFFEHQARHRTKIVDGLLVELAKRGQHKESAELSKLLTASKSQKLSLSVLREFSSIFDSISVGRLPFIYKFHLLSAHDMWPGLPFYGARLRRRAEILRAIDAKLVAEDIDQLTISDIDQSLFVRKLNAIGLSDTEKRRLLSDWVALSRDAHSDSVMLHASILGHSKRETV